MSSVDFQLKLTDAIAHLRSADPKLAIVIDCSPRCDIVPHEDYFRSLAGSIIGQQLSVKAARSIRDRFAAIGVGNFPTPHEIMMATETDLRTIGLSFAKIKYLKDLSSHVLDGSLDLVRLPQLSNAEITANVTDVKGIGEWTAQMFLMFCLGRFDVLPTGDLGIRKGMVTLYGLTTLPNPEAMIKIASDNNWTGYETIASWYIWRSLDNAPD